MRAAKQGGRRETFSVSVSAGTKARLRKAADRDYGGNVSALIEALAAEADRREAIDWLLERFPPIDDRVYEAFLKEMQGPKRRRPSRAA